MTWEEMKPGELYRVVEGSERSGYKLEKVEPAKGQIVVLDLPASVAYIFKVYAAILDNTLEGKIIESLEALAEDLGNGEVLGEEVRAAYNEQFKQADPAALSS